MSHEPGPVPLGARWFDSGDFVTVTFNAPVEQISTDISAIQIRKLSPQEWLQPTVAFKVDETTWGYAGYSYAGAMDRIRYNPPPADLQGIDGSQILPYEIPVQIP